MYNKETQVVVEAKTKRNDKEEQAQKDTFRWQDEDVPFWTFDIVY